MTARNLLQATLQATRSAAAAAALLGHAGAQQWLFLDGPAYSGRMATFDWARGRLVAFGQDGATWEFAGSQLLHRPVAGNPPPPRTNGAMIFDLARRRVLMFGGIGPARVNLGDTWIWDGARWTQLLNGPQPPARSDAGSVYDLVRGRIVMYGGQQLFVGQLSDTWEHDGTQWIPMTPATVPGPNSPAMAYDLLRGVVVMVNHSGTVNTPVTTWEWNGVDWTQRATTGPVANGNEAMAYDPVRSRTVLFGGVGTNDQIWEWDGTSWQPFVVPGAPPRLNPAVHFDPTRGRIGIVGGWDFQMSGSSVAQGSARTDAWEWDGTALTQVRGDLRPGSRFGHLWVADRARGEIVLFGGFRQQAPVDETWTWDGNTWTERLPASRPSARSGMNGAWDPALQRVLLFGGNSAGTLRNDLWAWDGTNWTLVDGGTGPSPRSAAGIAFDELRGRAVLFGGNASTSFRNDTWEWNGSAWSQRATATAPSPREDPAMAFDPLRARTVLFGGRNGATAANQFADLWEWDGNQWQAIAVAPAPPALLQPSMHYDAASASMLLTGTIVIVTGQTFETQIWRYGNGTWTQLAADRNPQIGGPSALDPRRQRVVFDKGTVIAEWSPTPAGVASFGSACGAPAARLAARARPRVGEPAFGLETSAGGGQAVLFALADAQGNVPLANGCTLRVAGSVGLALAATHSGGEAEVVIPIPAAPVLRGLVMYAQAAVLDSNAAGGFRLTQGLQLEVGD